jgi:peptidoglycan/xylan/chitin deacetylase (PgdA/CDA1 family)
MDGIYEYGSRAGVWRLLREFEKRGLPLTVFGVTTALQRHRELAQAFADLGHEVACHGLKWVHYQNVPEEIERAHMQQAMDIFKNIYGNRVEHGLGWYTGRDSPNTHRLVADFGGFAYDSDYYGDDLPFWMKLQKSDGAAAHQLIVPYTLKDSFDVLYAEGNPHGENRPKMMSIGMHCRLLGRPGRITALQRFLDHIQQHDNVWVCKRIDIARHWAQHFPAPVL